MSKHKTSSEVKSRWIKKAYSRYLVNFRKDADGALIDYVEENKDTIGTTEISRKALTEYIKQEKK